MYGKDVSVFTSAESQRKLNDNHDAVYLRVKLKQFSAAFNTIERASQQRGLCQSDKSYGWIPFPADCFVEILTDAFRALGNETGKSFLDVGCGIGTKVLLAATMFDAHGIEISEEHLELSHRLGCPTNRTFKADALDYNGYHRFDFIYFYRPIRDEEIQTCLEEHIRKSMKVGAVIAPMLSVQDWEAFPEFKRKGPYLYQKKRDGHA